MNRGLIDLKEEARVNTFVAKVFSWMFLALLTTGLLSYLVASSDTLTYMIFSNTSLIYGLLIGEIVLVIFLSSAINRISPLTATIGFFLYSAINGITISVIFLVYTAESIASTFFITAATFGIMSLYGLYTKKDLTSIGSLCFMGLIGIILASLVNLFLRNEMIYWITSFIGIFVFVGLTAYDTQKIKQIGMRYADESTMEKAAIIAALGLYLDFVNLFLHLLRFLGKKRD
ncbi:MAG: Bax inhibitor-1/YccA family protein [Halanaerobiaceae bacterium]|nr:Bax inhibitor-1/YccA family protein [Halanaerobiaceae bacterium]